MGTREHAAVVAGGDPKGIDTFRPECSVLGLQEIDETQAAVVGGKGAHLGRESKASACRLASA
jgi:rifampicin phosphotransferase